MVVLPHRRKAFRAAASGGSVVEPYWDNTVALLHLDGASASTTITNNKSLDYSQYVQGAAKLNTSVYKFGTASVAISAAGDSIKFADSKDYFLMLNGEPFTIEQWVYFNSTAGTQVFSLYKGGGSDAWNVDTGIEYNMGYISGSTIYAAWYAGGNAAALISVSIASAGIITNTWFHYAIAFDGTTIRMFINGVLKASTSVVSLVPRPYTTFKEILLGAGSSGLYPMNGYIDDFRVTRGVCRYTTNFTPPTEAYPHTTPGIEYDPYWSSVVLLLQCDGANGSTTFTDSSIVGRTMTAGGDACITTTEPKFGSGAATFDGTGDKITAADSEDWNFGTGDFTVEGWVYPASTSAQQTIIAQWNTANTAFFFGVGSGLGLYLNSGLVIPYTSWPSANTWHHFAFTRSGVYVRLFINGTQSGSTVNFGSGAIQNSSSLLGIGRDDYGNPFFSGKMDDIRITKGVARYTSNFSVPTKALPSVGMQSYGHILGHSSESSNRTSLITVTQSGPVFGGALSRLVGNGASSTYFVYSTIGSWFMFDFNRSVRITQIAMSQQYVSTQGFFQAAGSNDNTNWTNIGSPFEIGININPWNCGTAMESNTAYYRYYKFTRTTAGGNPGPWNYGFSFKISA